MLTDNELRDSLVTTSNKYIILKKKFTDFTENLLYAFGSPDSAMKGLSINPFPDTNKVGISFVGLELQIIFSVAIKNGEPNRTIGVVRCYSLVKHPEEKLVDVGGFTFSPNGESDLTDPSENERLNIIDQRSAWHIGMHIIHEALVV